MFKKLVATGAIALACTMASRADAAVTYRFEPETLVGLTSLEAMVTFSDAAFAAGKSIGFVDFDSENFDGLLSFELDAEVGFTVAPDIAPRGFLNLLDFEFYLGSEFLTGRFSAAPSHTEQSGGTTGLEFFGLDPEEWRVAYGTDNGASVCYGPSGPLPGDSNCWAIGVWRRVHVPEPASAPILLSGLAGLLGMSLRCSSRPR